MAVEITGQVGPSSLSDGNQGQALRQGRTGELIVSGLNGPYYERASRAGIFTAANQSAVTTTVGLATTYTGLCLANDAGSNVNLVLIAAGFAVTVAPAAITAVGLMGGVGAVTHTTPIAALAIRSTKIATAGGHASTTKVDGAATIPTPTLLEVFEGGNTATALDTSAHNISHDLNGRYVLPPGTFVAIYTLAVAVGLGFIQWSEEPI